ncbi:MAG: outer membrane protein assembly factor BamA, partial [Gammaproteobacteria bacterium]|nr:outer membrane protein assembly factor BamA [Gammaproteobacteria bacterium]
GNDSTQDQVYRREMRLMEGSILASDLLERSKTRIQRLPYIESVNVDTSVVPGSNNQVDLKVTVVEKLAGSFNIGAGFSQTQGLLFNVGLTQENLFGTGKRLTVNVNTDRANTIYSAAYTNPYYTLDGISRSLSVSFRDRDASEELINNFQTSSGDLNVTYGIPLSEFNTLSLGYGYSHISITPSTVNPSNDVLDFIAENDGKTAYNSLTLNTSFSHDTRNRTVFATAGTQQTLGMKTTVPGSDLEYYKISYITNTYIRVTSATTLLLRSNLAYGNGYGKTSELPFYERYFAGGIRTVRGYESNSLGPRDIDPDTGEATGLAIGGNMRVTAGADYIFPIPFIEKPPGSVRLSAFLDIGNVFLSDRPTYDAADDETGFQLDQLRSSVGVSLVWISPIGPLRFSYAETINDVPDDDLRAFQFSIGSFF